jgi:ketosteroid isomerase-like protein
MSVRSAFTLALALAAAVPAARAAETPSAAPAPAAPELTRLLLAFLDGAGRNDPVAHERFWADDLVYTGSGGSRRGKAEIMKSVTSAPAPGPGDPVTRYGAEDVRIQQYGDAALVAFRLVATTTHGDSTEVANYLNTGMFVRRRGEWRVVGWQATKAAP